MESRQWNAAAVGAAQRPEDPPYAGTAGQTRVEVAQLMLPSGQAVSVQVHRVVNVATDPHLGTPALAGILHRYDVGFELGLAVDFVYHDPAKRRFALVIPDSLRHDELRLRAKLLEQIAEDAANPAPQYVREATTVVGVQALREYLERGDGRSALAAAEADLARRERDLAGREGKLRERETTLKSREERLVKRAEGVTSREDELAARADEIETSMRDLAVREREINARAEAVIEAEQRVSARERELSTRAVEPPRNLLDAVVRASAAADGPAARVDDGGGHAGFPGAVPWPEAGASQEHSPVLFGGALAPLATSIGQAPSLPPITSQPGVSSSTSGVTTPGVPPVAPRIDSMETRRVVLTPAGQLVGASALIPSLGGTMPSQSPTPPVAPHAPSPYPAAPPHPAAAAPAASPGAAPLPMGSGPIPSLAHPAHAAPHAAAAPSPRALGAGEQGVGSSAPAPIASLTGASSHAVHHAPTVVAPKPASVPPPAPPSAPSASGPSGGSPGLGAAVSGSVVRAFPADAHTARSEPAGNDDEDVVDATDLVVEATGFVRLDEVEELAEEEDVEELDVIDEVTGVGRPPSRTEAKSAGAAQAGRARAADRKQEARDPVTVEDAVDDGKTSVVAPPKQRAAAVVVPGAWWRSGSQAHVQVVDGTVRYYFRADADSAKRAEDGCEVRCQLAVVDGAPVVLLTLVVGDGATAQALARAAIDTGREEERRVLDTLRRAYRMQVVPVDALGQAMNVVDAVSPREVNVARLVERLARFSTDREHGGGLSLRAVDKALSSPPPLHDPEEPFSTADGDEPGTARAALDAIERLKSWSAPERLERVLLGLSIPNDRVDVVFRRTLESAVRFGIALPEPLARRAIALGVATDRGALVTQQITSFGEVLAGRRPSGLDRDQSRENWDALVNVAADADVAVDAAVADIAAGELDLGSSSGAAAAPPPDPGVLALLETSELIRRLDTGPGRDVIALELCRRSATDAVESLGRALRKMSRDEVVRVVPSMLRLGESVGDVLVEGLGAREAHVRQVAALGLGVLRLRRAAVPLIHLLLSETTETWREVARALGDFGPSAVRPIVRFLKEPKGKDDRLSEALAHLSRACLGDVERLARDENPTAAAIAQRALASRSDTLERDEAVRAQRPLGEADDVTKVSHRFFEELNAVGELRSTSREAPAD